MEDHIYNKAKKKVQRKKNLFKDITGWVSTSIFLFFINLFFTPGFLWCLFPIGFYGLSILITYVDLISERFDDDWEEKELEREYRKLLKKQEGSELPIDALYDLDQMKKVIPKWNEKDLV